MHTGTEVCCILMQTQSSQVRHDSASTKARRLFLQRCSKRNEANKNREQRSGFRYLPNLQEEEIIKKFSLTVFDKVDSFCSAAHENWATNCSYCFCKIVHLYKYLPHMLAGLVTATYQLLGVMVPPTLSRNLTTPCFFFFTKNLFYSPRVLSRTHPGGINNS